MSTSHDKAWARLTQKEPPMGAMTEAQLQQRVKEAKASYRAVLDAWFAGKAWVTSAMVGIACIQVCSAESKLVELHAAVPKCWEGNPGRWRGER